MSQLQRFCKTLGVLGLAAALPALVSAQSSYVKSGSEYAPAGSLPGDQIFPSISINQSGGFLVWQDNITDGDGYGISAVRLDNNFAPTLGNFRVNQQGAGDQEKPQVALLQNGGAAFVWQGGPQSFQYIYARFLNSSNTFTGGDVLVNTATNKYQSSPAISALTNGNVIVTWASYGQDNSDGLQGVYAQILSPTGQKIGGEFPVNQFTPFNQRSPAVAAFSTGGFVIAWVSEQQRSSPTVDGSGGVNSPNGTPSVDIYARLFDATGAPLGNEFLVNTGTNASANPGVAAASDGSFVISWCEKDTVVLNNSWDIFARPFSSAGLGGTVQRVNTQQYGDQYDPKISAVGTDYLSVWTSLGQDGSWEGVYGQFLHSDGSHAGGEFRVNTGILNAQKFQTVASDGVSRFMVGWSSYAGGINSMDVRAQRYANTQQPLLPPGAPFVAAVSSSRLSVTWPPLSGFSVANYDLYIDGSMTPTVVTNNMWTMSGLPPDASHSFSLDYVLTDGRRSPQSQAASGMTWGVDDNSDGLPDDWQALYWGADPNGWPSPGTRLGTGGPTVLQVFQWGANPFDPNTWLRTSMVHTAQGWFFSWNTVPGSVYQVDSSSSLPAWASLGSPRFAAGTNDAINVGISNAGFYRVRRIRF